MSRKKLSKKKMIEALPRVANGKLKVTPEGKVLQKRAGKWEQLDWEQGEQGFYVTYRDEKQELHRSYVHHLVAEGHLSNPESKPEVIFLDGNDTNLLASNLAWATVTEAVAHYQKLGANVPAPNRLKPVVPMPEKNAAFLNLPVGKICVGQNGKIFALKNGEWRERPMVQSDFGPLVVVYGKKYLAHRLVAQAHVPNPENKSTVIFLNEDRSDIAAQNLTWATQSESIAYYKKSKAKASAAPPWSNLPELCGGILRAARDGTVYFRKNGIYVKLENKTRSADGYKYVEFEVNGVIKTKGLHQILAEAYVPRSDPKKYCIVGFINNDLRDVQVENLKWMTCEEANQKWYMKCPSCGVQTIHRSDNMCVHCHKQEQSTRARRFEPSKPVEPKQKFVWSELPEVADGLIRIASDGTVYGKKGDGFILKEHYLNNGSPAVAIVVNRKRRVFAVHRLLAEAYIPNPDPAIFQKVSFINADKKDISIENLQWISNSGEVPEANKKKPNKCSPAHNSRMCSVCGVKSVSDNATICMDCMVKQKEVAAPKNIVVTPQPSQATSSEAVPEAKTPAAPASSAPIPPASVVEFSTDIRDSQEAIKSGLVRPTGREDNTFSRDYEILEMRANGSPIEDITKEFSLSSAKVRQIISSRTLVYRTVMEVSRKSA